MRTLAKFLLALVAVMALAMSLALGFDESAVNYSNQDMKVLYVGLDHGPQGLLVTLSEGTTIGTVGSMDVEDKLTDYDHDWFTDGTIYKHLGNVAWAKRAFPDLVSLEYVSLDLSNNVTSIGFQLQEPMPTVTAAYLARLDALGFEVTEETSATPNIGIYTVSRPGEVLRMVIARQGADTFVHLAPLAPT